MQLGLHKLTIATHKDKLKETRLRKAFFVFIFHVQVKRENALPKNMLDKGYVKIFRY